MRALDKPSERRERTSNDCHTFLPIETFLSYLLPKCGYVSHLHLCITANALPHFLLKTATLNFYSHAECWDLQPGEQQSEQKMRQLLPVAFALVCWFFVPIISSFIISQGSI